MTDIQGPQPMLLDHPPKVTSLSDSEIIIWLRRGFTALGTAQKPSEVRFAFDPVEIHPDSEPVSQLAGALLEEDLPALPSPAQVEQALRRYLVRDAIACDPSDFLCQLWQLLSALNLAPDIAAPARQFLNQLKAIGSEDAGPLVRAVAAAVSVARPVTNQQISFFEHLSEGWREIWDADLTHVAVDLAFAKAADDRMRGERSALAADEVWAVVQSEWADGILAILREGGLPARAFLSMVARHGSSEPQAMDIADLIRGLARRRREDRDEGHVRFEPRIRLRKLGVAYG